MPDSRTSDSAKVNIMEYPIPKWVKDAVFYEIFPERFANGDPSNDPPDCVAWTSTPTRDNFFGGDLQGIIDHLPYLEDLGVTALYVTPVFKARTNHKYDICDYLSVDPAFGTNELLRRLVAKAHDKGIRVILGAVFNHCGDGFWAFEDLTQKGASSKYASWFFVDSYPVSKDPPNYQTAGGAWYLPKLNTANPEVRDYLLKVANYWIEECGIDGWRLDVPWKVPLDFWRLFRDTVKRAKPDAYIVGEVWRDPRPWLQGDTWDGVMNYPLRNHILDYCVHDTMDAEDFDYEIGRLRQVHGRAAPCQLNLLGSHDTPRLLTLCNGDVDRAILAVAFLLTYVGAPMIYYGDEVGLTGGNDPDCRRAMPWDETIWEPRLLEIHRVLIKARHEHPALRLGDFEKLWVFNGVYAYRRRHESDEIVVILNPREMRRGLRVPLHPAASSRKTWCDIISGDVFIQDGNYLQIERLPSKAVMVLRSEDGGKPTER